MSKGSADGGSRRGLRGGQVAVGGDAALGPNARVVNRTTINNIVRPEMEWPLRVGAVPPLASSFLPSTALRAVVETARDFGQDVGLGKATDAGRVLEGEGGVGKSQLAASYYLRPSADLAVWTTAKGGIAQLVADFAETARRLQAPGAEGENEEADARALLEWLRGTERSWLVVIDDVDDLDAVLPWWPHSYPALYQVGDRLGEAGQDAAARDYFHTLAARTPSHLGRDHSSTLRAWHSLGRWRGEAGDAQCAADTLAELVPHFLRVLGPDHPDTLRFVNALARWQERAMNSDAPSA
ncbi:hypothetical protein ABZ379_37420 [Streptomyces canus]|uniref:hypothetical protein n=1 Tax=Streptomyces canus TaxID=58343 RepID=UPI003408357F